MEIYNKVLNYIKKNNLIQKEDSIICAVSGGADSVCLLDLLVRMSNVFSLKLYIAHLNHQLRGLEADHDEEFVRCISEKYNLPFFCKKEDINTLSRHLKISCEEAGRIARYDFFSELKKELNAKKIATAHNKNDNIETVLMRLIRGTDIKGLSGIPVCNSSSVIRPVLCLKRSEIEEYIKCKGLSFVSDSTNFENIYLRNKIRNFLIPAICDEFNSGFIDTFTASMDLFKEANVYLEKQVDYIYKQSVSKNTKLISFPVSIIASNEPYIIKQIIKKAVYDLCGKSVTNDLCNLIYNTLLNSDNTSICINSEVNFYIKYDMAFLAKNQNFEHFSYKINSLGTFSFPEIGMTINITTGEGQVNFSDKNTIYLDAEKVSIDFTLRNRIPGDRIQLPNCGNKKIKDILIDEKIPVFLRYKHPILEYNNKTIWLCGIRDNVDYRAKSGNKYIKLTIHNT